VLPKKLTKKVALEIGQGALVGVITKLTSKTGGTYIRRSAGSMARQKGQKNYRLLKIRRQAPQHSGGALSFA